MLFVGNVAIYAAFPFLFAYQKSPAREVSFYVYIAVLLVLGGFFGGVYAFPLSPTISVSGGNVLYGAFMMSIILLLIVEHNLRVIRNLVWMVVVVTIFESVLSRFFTLILSHDNISNPYGVNVEVFDVSIWVMVLGSLLILSELVLVLFVFEKLKQHIRRLP